MESGGGYGDGEENELGATRKEHQLCDAWKAAVYNINPFTNKQRRLRYHLQHAGTFERICVVKK